DFSNSGDRAFAAAPAGALLDAHGGRDAGDEIDVGPGELLDELAGVSVHRIQKAALPLGKEQIEGEGAFARPAHPGNNHELVSRNDEREVLQIVLPRAINGDRIFYGWSVARHYKFLTVKAAARNRNRRESASSG